MTPMGRRLAAGCVAACCLLGPACGGNLPSTPSSTPSTQITPTEPVTVSKPTIVLGRPTERSVVAVVKVDAGTEVYLEYGTSSGATSGHTTSAVGTGDKPVFLAIDGLATDTAYSYRARYRGRTESAYRTDTEHVFHTKRLSGRTFTFVIQADPHLDGNSGTAVYTQTLANELGDRPDFMVDLGDTSMTEKCMIDGATLCLPPAPATQATVKARYALMRSYFEQACHSVPLFMVLGNHDGETGWPDPNASLLSEWSNTNRKELFANPEPDSFYTGSSEMSPGIGLRQNYYAFEWGDALVVVLDPYTHTPAKPGADGWGWTLGATQYQWFARTLSASRARYKFVFSHHMLGGKGSETRGGAAFAQYFEWGGRNLDGTWGFGKQRPGWAAPIHQLLVDNKVTAWFHGHDHLYVREELDGVVYQEVPQPSLARYDTPNPGGDYGYLGTVGVNMFPSSGHLRVTVGPAEVRVEYVGSVAPADVTATRKNGAVVTSYVVR
jgi:hypothetical protein